MKNVPIAGLLSIIFGVVLFLLPHLIPYLLPLYLVVSGILKIINRNK